jgi:hypothetical protein
MWSPEEQDFDDLYESIDSASLDAGRTFIIAFILAAVLLWAGSQIAAGYLPKVRRAVVQGARADACLRVEIPFGSNVRVPARHP